MHLQSDLDLNSGTLGFITILLARWGLCSFYCLQSILKCFKKDISNDLCYVSVTRVFLTFSCISHLMFDWYKSLVPVTLNWYPTYGLTAHIYVLHPPISSRYQLIWMYFVINADRVRGKLMSILKTVSSSGSFRSFHMYVKLFGRQTFHKKLSN